MVNHNDSDYEKLYSIAEFFAKDGADVYLAPKMTRPGKFEYNCIFNDAEYPPKCPDLKINGIWYEHEGFKSENPKNAFRNMVNHGLKQSSRIIIERPELTERYMRQGILNRLDTGEKINEIWIRETDGTLRLLYKKTDGQP